MPTQSPTENKLEEPHIEVITPLLFKEDRLKGDVYSRNRHPMFYFFVLGIAVVALLLTGRWFFQYLAKDQVIPEQQTTPVLGGVSSKQLRPGLGAEPKPTEIVPDHRPPKMEKEVELKPGAFQQVRKEHENTSEQKELEREKKTKHDQFHRLISEGLLAMHKNEYENAHSSLLKAKELQPDSPEVRDAWGQLEQELKLTNMEKLRGAAADFEKSEDWERALKSYLDVIGLDPNVRFALEGRERSLTHIRMNKRVNFFLSRPHVLESDQQLQNAISLLDQAEGMERKGPQMVARIKKLKSLVEAAQTPVKVNIESDNLTEVAIYRVGRLGRFTIIELNLRPGTYTIVGSRDGYRDVRQKITVKPNQKPLHVTIICRNKV
ncbi:hypothetical protein ACFL9T_17080 [Thermodesulfobacteriota bacterium]